jgi:hemerythrin
MLKRGMRMFQFTDDCITGYEVIDNEHRKLFDLLNKAYILLTTEYHSDYYTELKTILEDLEYYADQHFTHEEEEMVKLRDPELIHQRSQHAFFRDKVRELEFVNIDSTEEQQIVLSDLVNFLAKWLYHHILSSDILIGKLPPLEEWMVRENPCEFTDDYLTGINIVDIEHKELFRIVDKANHLIKSFDELTGYDSIMAILDELTEYTKEHFGDEEEYMEKIGYEGLAAQKRAHESFIDKLENIDLNEIDKNPREELQALLEFLLGWLINHILYTDKKIPVVDM